MKKEIKIKVELYNFAGRGYMHNRLLNISTIRISPNRAKIWPNNKIKRVNLHLQIITELRRKGRQAEPHNYRNRITCMHRNRNPCNSFLMVKMPHGSRARGPNDDDDENDVAQYGGHPANTKSCSLGLQRRSLILDVCMMFS